MRTKLFLAFLTIIVIALISNLIYEYFIIRDFDEYVSGIKEDRLYWILASTEGSYSEGQWDIRTLHDSIHWAMMLGFDIKVIDKKGAKIADSDDVIHMLSPSMRLRMEGIVDLKTATGEYESYPLYIKGNEIGTLLVRELKRPISIIEKEHIFKKRGKTFLIVSFIIAGTGALILAVFFTLFLSRPIKRMKEAVNVMSKSDFSIRLPVSSKDEIGSLAESFNFMAEALQREEILRKRLTSNIAHELRTPLAIIKANLEAMADGIIDNTEQVIENVKFEVDKLIRLVEGIEDVTKAEASFFSKLGYTELELHNFLSAIVSKMLPLASEKNLEINIIEKDPLHVISDAEKLERIIQNIVTNAIRNTETGGVWIDYGRGQEMFFIQVRDSGKGIHEDNLPHIFNRFYRGEDSIGIGLGLAIVKELIDVMGGKIDVKSAIGKGSTFTIYLPDMRKVSREQ